VLVVVAAGIGGRAAAIGGVAALAAQLGAVGSAAARDARSPAAVHVPLARRDGGARVGGGGRARDRGDTSRRPPPLPAALGFLGVLLPLLFLETRFLR